MKIIFEQKFDIDVKDLNDPVVLIGWPGIALVGKLAISSIKDSIDAKLFMEIFFYDFPPKSSVEKGDLTVPSAKLYYKSRKPERDLFILTADYQPQSPEGVFDFSQQFCEKLNELLAGKINMYLSSGAMVSDNIEGPTPKVMVCGSDDKIVESFLKSENTELMDSGVVAGANGILPAWAGNRGFAPGVCLLAETMPMPMMNLDPKASKALVTVLKDYFNIEMDYEELDKKIEEMEKVFESFKQQASNFMREGRKKRESSDSYFR